MSNTDNISSSKAEFSKLRSIFWPVHKYELKKFISMSLLMFCILFVYTMMRDFKDIFIQTYSIGGGTETLSVIKLFFVMPFAFLVVIFYTLLINKFGFNKTFYIVISIFAGFFAFFIYFLFPNYENIHPNLEQVRTIQESLPGFLYYVVPCVTNWSFTLFYMMSEIWGTMAISSLFWRFANEITMKNEVKRFFGLYSLIGNVGVFLSGSTLKIMSQAQGSEWSKNVTIAITICVILSIVSMAIFYYITNSIMTNPKFYTSNKESEKKTKEKISVMDGIKFLFTNKYLLLIALLVICYGLSDNLFEVVWKEEMRNLIPKSNEYAGMMGTHSQLVSIFTIISTIIAANILRKCKWKTAAIISPIMILMVSTLFFSLVVYIKHTDKGNSNIMGISLTALAVWIGVVGVAAFKAIKYSLFDPTKSMAYLPLDNDIKTKGQAAVEVIGGRVGKAGGSATTYILTNIISVGSKISKHVYTIIPIAIISLIAWIISVLGLSNKYEEKMLEIKNSK